MSTVSRSRFKSDNKQRLVGEFQSLMLLLVDRVIISQHIQQSMFVQGDLNEVLVCQSLSKDINRGCVLVITPSLQSMISRENIYNKICSLQMRHLRGMTYSRLNKPQAFLENLAFIVLFASKMHIWAQLRVWNLLEENIRI